MDNTYSGFASPLRTGKNPVESQVLVVHCADIASTCILKYTDFKNGKILVPGYAKISPPQIMVTSIKVFSIVFCPFLFCQCFVRNVNVQEADFFSNYMGVSFN